jgi:hypothetical protein
MDEQITRAQTREGSVGALAHPLWRVGHGALLPALAALGGAVLTWRQWRRRRRD